VIPKGVMLASEPPTSTAFRSSSCCSKVYPCPMASKEAAHAVVGANGGDHENRVLWQCLQPLC